MINLDFKKTKDNKILNKQDPNIRYVIESKNSKLTSFPDKIFLSSPSTLTVTCISGSCNSLEVNANCMKSTACDFLY